MSNKLLYYDADRVRLVGRFRRKSIFLYLSPSPHKPFTTLFFAQVHDYEGLENESLYLTVRITDIYCSVHDVILAEIQLVGIAAIFIASKQEERFPPEGKDLVRYTNNAYAIDDLYRMEVEILDRLKFKVSI